MLYRLLHRFTRLLCAGVFGWVALTSLVANANPTRLVHAYLGEAISPNGLLVASVEGDRPPGGRSPLVRELVLRRVADAAVIPVELPCGHEPQCWPGSLAWTPDGAHLTFTLRKPGSHAYSIYQVAADGTAVTKLLDFNGTILDLKYAPDGTLAMLATAEARKESGATEAGAAIAGDLDAAPAEQRIAILFGGGLLWASPPDLYVYEYDWRGGSAGFVGTAAPGDGDNNWWIAKLYDFDAASATGRVIYTPQSGREQLADPHVSPDGHTVVFIAGIMSDFGSTGGDVYALSLDGGHARNLTPGMPASARALSWGCDGKLLAQMLAGDAQQIVEIGMGPGAATRRVLESTMETRRGASSSPACPGDLHVTSHESFIAAPELAVGTPGHWHDLTNANAGFANSLKVESVNWVSDNFHVQGWLLLPASGSGKHPMITIVHGGPAAAHTQNFIGPGLVQGALERGWAIFLPNPRGSFGQGERFTAANVRDFGYGDLRDILTGIDAAKKIAPIDEERLGLTGGSYGGFMTMWAVTQTNRFKAAVAAAGISNWQSYYGENGIDEWMLPYFGASVYEDPAVYAKSSPMTYIRKVRTPTFAYVGERDVECPAPQTQEFWHALKTLGVPTSIMIYPGEGHAMRDPAHAEDAEERTLAWFDRYLK